MYSVVNQCVCPVYATCNRTSLHACMWNVLVQYGTSSTACTTVQKETPKCDRFPHIQALFGLLEIYNWKFEAVLQ